MDRPTKRESGRNRVLKILVCDDDREIARAIEIYLKNAGFDTCQANDGIQAIEMLKKEDIQLVIMDIMMPKMDGIEATRKIRQEKNIPIIMLTAKSEDYDLVNGLDAGADDYITKPFNSVELVARVKALLRRYTTLGSMPVKSNGEIKVGGIVLDTDRKTVSVDGEDVIFTPKEYGVLECLMMHPGRVFSMEQIYEAVWNEPAYNPENTVAVHIRHIREKIEIDPKNPRYLKVVWGIGYKIEA